MKITRICLGRGDRYLINVNSIWLYMILELKGTSKPLSHFAGGEREAQKDKVRAPEDIKRVFFGALCKF